MNTFLCLDKPDVKVLADVQRTWRETGSAEVKTLARAVNALAAYCKSLETCIKQLNETNGTLDQRLKALEK